MNVLAIDPATETGWAMSAIHYGTWNLRKHKDESVGIRLLRLRSHLKELCSLANVNIIAYEKPGGRNYAALINHAKLVGEIEKFCEENGIEYKGYSASEIKRFATGKGNAKKPQMVEAAKKRFGYTGDNDNIADALWILAVAKNEFGLAWEL